jgi:radical SAM protein with 4Fe4S-binding SPASM domain
VLTENCNASCEHCFNADVRDKGIMDADTYIRFMRENSAYLRPMAAKLMGGEPTLHPRILDIMLEACKHYRTVNLFTNGLRMDKIAPHPEIIKYHFQKKIKYIINGYIFDIDKFESYRKFVDSVVLHFVITKQNTDQIIEKILKCIQLGQVGFTLSCDTQVDLFDDNEMEEYRKTWLDAMSEVVPQISRDGLYLRTDHNFPLCFFTQEMLDKLNIIGLDNYLMSCCKCQEIGLINWNFDLYYCNQTRIKIGSILNEDGSIKSVEELIQTIQPFHGKKVENIKKLRDKCKNCAAVSSCRVGCYYNTLVKHNLKGGRK